VGKKEIQVTFETITPLWTGDINGKCTEIKPASIIGSLRFWFEVICFFSGICNKKDFRNGRFEKEVDREKFKICLKNKDITFESKIECLLKQNIPLPSTIFGTTNWKSLIEIKSIKYLEDYCFGNRLKLPYVIGLKKNSEEESLIFEIEKEWIKKINSYKGKNFKDRLKEAKKEWSFFFFFNPYFYGKFEIKFQIEEKILGPIFYPLLTFMDRYGFWGGKWNIGYGRLNVKEIKINYNSLYNWSKEEFTFKEINNKYENKKFEDFIKSDTSNFDNLIQKKNNIQIFNTNNLSNSFIEIIKELIRTKAQERAKFRSNTEERHKIFGKTDNSKNIPYVPQGSKILPFIYKENGQLKGGLLSIAGLLNLEGGNNG